MSKKGRPEGPHGLTTRVKTARGRKKSSTQWLQRQLNDPYVRKAQQAGYRSRAAFKLIELDEKFGLLNHADRIVDLGAAPGGWLQVCQQRHPKATLVGIDLLPIETMADVTFLEMDFMDDEAPDALKEALGGKANLVLSDMAPNSSGQPKLDHLRIMMLVEAAVHFAIEVLHPGGSFAAKVWQGGADQELLKLLRENFEHVKHAKPAASRKGSAETYLVATGFKGAE